MQGLNAASASLKLLPGMNIALHLDYRNRKKNVKTNLFAHEGKYNAIKQNIQNSF